MKAEKFSEAMGEIDGKYVDEALAYGGKSGRIRHIRRLPIAAAAALLVILLLGGAVLAFDFFGFGTQLKGWFRSEDESGFDLSVEIEKVSVDAFSPEIREVGDTIKQQFENYDPISSWFPGAWQQTFASRGEACDFIGFERLRRIDLGYDERGTTLNVQGNEQGQLLSVDLETGYSIDGLNVQFFSHIYTEYCEDEIETGVRTTEDLEFGESWYDAAGGRQCHIISSSAMESGYLGMDGYIVDDGVMYTLHIAYKEDASAQAEELMHAWADLF